MRSAAICLFDVDGAHTCGLALLHQWLEGVPYLYMCSQPVT